MKKGIFFTMMILGVMAVSSLKAQFSVGPGIVYGTNIEALGIEGVVHYAFPGKIGLMGGYTYFFEKNNVNWSAIDLDATYSIYDMGDRGSVYALAGVNMLYVKVPGVTIGEINIAGRKTNDSGLNLGVGWKIGISSAMSLVPEIRYTLGGGDYLRAGIKLMFGLGSGK